MHIPNGFLDPKVSAGAAFAAAGVLGYCVAKVRQALSRLVPDSVLAGAGNIGCSITEGSKKLMGNIASNHLMKMGAIGSLIFSAQMFNFPVDNGTSGHLIGGVLAVITLGPFSGTLVIAMILAVQSLMFGDGGIMALGANILNMAVIGAFVPYYIYYVVNKLINNRFGFNLGVMLASLSSVLLAAIACSMEIGLSGTIALGQIFPVMVSIHARIGIAEALITLIVVELLIMQKFELDGRIKYEQ
jgi:cobalt/nickel transport system permease protein